MLIPFVFELRQGPLLVIPHAMASLSLTPNFIKLRTLVHAIPFIKSAIAASSTFLSYDGSNDLNPLLVDKRWLLGSSVPSRVNTA